MFNFPKIIKLQLKIYKILKYSSQNASQWNAFVSNSKNGTFLHNRNFMDYHSDRFNDFSLIVLDNQKWVAILPANISKNEVHSHQGLTYGGLIYDEKLKLESVILVLKAILNFLNNEKINKLHIKTIPAIYHKKPAEEINYALFLANAKLVRRDSLSVLDLQQTNELSKLRKRNINKIKAENDLSVVWNNTFKPFWETILTPNLEKKFNTKPVHSLDEIEKLFKNFPENIHQFDLYKNNELICGATIFETETVVHAQYIAGNEGLDYLFNHLINDHFENKKFFDFGISNEQQGRKLNMGLSNFKQSFGASTIVHDCYEIDTQNHVLLDNFLI